jgi:hypothetical protein
MIQNGFEALPAPYQFLARRKLLAKCYIVHSVPLNVFSDDKHLYDITDSVLGCFPVQDSAHSDGLPLFVFHIDDDSILRHSPDPLGAAKKLIYEGPVQASTCSLYQLDHLVWGRFEPFENVFLDLNQGVAVCVVEKREKSHRSYESLTLAIPLLFRTRSYSLIHAAGAALEGKAVLICGGKGVGKTTISMALARDGFEFLSDEMLIIHQHGGRIEILPFPAPVKLARSALSLFPELRQKLGDRFSSEAAKQCVQIGECFPHKLASACTPSLLLFPCGFNESGHKVDHLDKEAAFSLLCRSSPDVTHPRWTMEHLETLWGLVTLSRTLRIRTGRNLHDLPRLIRSVMSDESMARSFARSDSDGKQAGSIGLTRAQYVEAHPSASETERARKTPRFGG